MLISPRIRQRLILILVLCGTVSAQPVLSSSMMEIPVRISLERLFAVAEKEMPQQTGHWRQWKKHHGVRTKYRAWRGPLSFTLQGDVLTVQAHVRYWIKAQKSLLGRLDINSSCGVNEPPRQAVIGIIIRLDWEPDWTLRSDFRVLPSRFLDRCAMTVANIDMTPLVEKEFRKQLESRMQTALTTLLPRLATIRQQAEQNWFRLQQPIRLWADHWLLLKPRGIALSPLEGSGNRLDARLALALEPEVLTNSLPEVQRQPLPPLMRSYPRSNGLNLQLAIELDYTDLNRAVSERLADKSLDIGGWHSAVEAIELGGQKQDLRIDVSLGGHAAGHVTLLAKLVFEPKIQQIQLEILDYSYQPEDPGLSIQENLFRGYIRRMLETTANRKIHQQTNRWKERLLATIREITPDGATLHMDSLQIRKAQLDITANAIKLNGMLSGEIVVEFH